MQQPEPDKLFRGLDLKEEELAMAAEPQSRYGKKQSD